MCYRECGPCASFPPFAYNCENAPGNFPCNERKTELGNSKGECASGLWIADLRPSRKRKRLSIRGRRVVFKPRTNRRPRLRKVFQYVQAVGTFNAYVFFCFCGENRSVVKDIADIFQFAGLRVFCNIICTYACIRKENLRRALNLLHFARF